MITSRKPLAPLWTTTFVLGLMGCRQGNASAEPRDRASVAVVAAGPTCASDSLRPATAAPAEGLWVYEAPSAKTRVAAMVGPAQAEAGTARITRRVETLEQGADAAAIRRAIDTASVRLEILPPFREPGGPSAAPSDAGGARPAAVYAVTPLVFLASYEPCASSGREPRIRYLRRDTRGDVVTDVMLRRESTEAAGALR